MHVSFIFIRKIKQLIVQINSKNIIFAVIMF